MWIYRLEESSVEAYQPVGALPASRARHRVSAGRTWVRERVTTTPGRLLALAALLLAGTIGFGIAATAAESVRARAAEAARSRTEPRLLDAVHIYGALSDANATVTATFTTGGLEPAARRARYVGDLRTASSALNALTRAIGGSADARPALTTIASQLPVYSGLIESARANNRQGLPVGAAYMRQASDVLASAMLPAAEHLFRLEALQLSEDYSSGTGAGALAVLVVAVVLALAVLVGAQVYVARVTRRTFNLPLVGATVVLVAISGWALVGVLGEQNALDRARTQGSDSVEVLSASSVLLARAQGDESLTVVNRGTDQADPADLGAVMRVLAPGRAGGGLIDEAATLVRRSATSTAADGLTSEFGAYRAATTRVDDLQRKGLIGEAILQAPAVTATAERLDQTVAGRLTAAQGRFERAAADATSSLAGLAVAIPLMTVLVVALALTGLAHRIGEYR